jgi:hypothetical protein
MSTSKKCENGKMGENGYIKKWKNGKMGENGGKTGVLWGKFSGLSRKVCVYCREGSCKF